MIAIDKTIISDDIQHVCFACDLEQCKGICCVEGDAGAPLDEDEIGVLEDELENFKAYMCPEGIAVVEQNGVFDYDEEGHYVTPLVKDQECAFVVFEDGKALCAIEKAWKEGKTSFRKPISCHLYPIRIASLHDLEAVNYHAWSVCHQAVENGKKLKVPLYKYLKEPLLRKYGLEWYNELVSKIEGK